MLNLPLQSRFHHYSRCTQSPQYQTSTNLFNQQFRKVQRLTSSIENVSSLLLWTICFLFLRLTLGSRLLGPANNCPHLFCQDQSEFYKLQWDYPSFIQTPEKVTLVCGSSSSGKPPSVGQLLHSLCGDSSLCQVRTWKLHYCSWGPSTAWQTAERHKVAAMQHSNGPPCLCQPWSTSYADQDFLRNLQWLRYFSG